MAAEGPRALLVVNPDVAGCASGQVGPHDHLDGQRRAFLCNEHVRVGNGDHVVGCDVLRLLEPPGSDVVQELALQREGSEHAIERADPVGNDDGPTTIAGRVVVPNLPFVPLAERGEVSAIERMLESCADRGLGDAGHARKLRGPGARRNGVADQIPRSLARAQNWPAPEGAMLSAFVTTLSQPATKSSTT